MKAAALLLHLVLIFLAGTAVTYASGPTPAPHSTKGNGVSAEHRTTAYLYHSGEEENGTACFNFIIGGDEEDEEDAATGMAKFKAPTRYVPVLPGHPAAAIVISPHPGKSKCPRLTAAIYIFQRVFRI